ncbi:MAG: pseudouridine-5'-phosphate glycosidase, partial [Chloroflexi bacterium]
LRLPVRADSLEALTSILAAHWELGGAGAVVSQPLPSDLAIPTSELGADESAPVRGPDRTPAELSHLQARLGDRVIQANVALLERNATLAGAVSAALTGRQVATPAHG